MRQMLTIATVIAAALWIVGCDSQEQQTQAQAGAVPVDVIKVATAPQAITLELPGRSRAYMEAEVRPQVSGIVEARAFVEGGEVQAGQSLYQIDASTYEAALVSAKAELERAKAALASTKATATRFKELVKTKSVSQQDYDQALAAYQQAQASVAVAKADINTAEINLEYTKVKAPISGRIGKSNVTPGALVGAGQTQALAVISQLDPINVDIVQSSTEILRLKQRIAAGSLAQPDNTTVTLILEDGTEYQHKGKLQFAEVTVNENTGAVGLRAEFPNPEGLLLPGMFVRTVLSVGTDPNAILVPQKAITRNPKGQGVAMIVNAENKVELRLVETAEALNNQWLITKGLQPGEHVIVAGLQKIRPGASVTPNLITQAQTKAK
ncbi:MAG: efflux RND transporter periplasmic adaptor subunit [Shewanella sp.]|nr:efflux RND transporter periplasmic adaptor subunit [Shewanella sp.]MCF1431985.1 efflux RND transporter periplasmic adaptor subunit [Shewanella sp.]MCF1437360.1 efflux RND transporter periplasmic adaptor subunit [Shewanella sp.]MCF1457236.1 efflux RND transporter periplasmic adaptor subunit [Shewanella sp.]